LQALLKQRAVLEDFLSSHMQFFDLFKDAIWDAGKELSEVARRIHLRLSIDGIEIFKGCTAVTEYFKFIDWQGSFSRAFRIDMWQTRFVRVWPSG